MSMPVNLDNLACDWGGIVATTPTKRLEMSGCDHEQARAWSAEYCAKCGKTVGIGEYRDSDQCCPACRHQRLLWDEFVRLGAYQGELRNWIHELKFERQEAMGRMLGNMLGEQVSTRPWAGDLDVVIPMPMTYRRRLRRGIDHSAVIARAISKTIEIPWAQALRRQVRPPQRAVSASKRQANVRGSFVPTRFLNISGASVLLVDDIATTHSSLIEACRVLTKKSGAFAVRVAVLAVADVHRKDVRSPKAALS